MDTMTFALYMWIIVGAFIGIVIIYNAWDERTRLKSTSDLVQRTERWNEAVYNHQQKRKIQKMDLSELYLAREKLLNDSASYSEKEYQFIQEQIRLQLWEWSLEILTKGNRKDLIKISPNTYSLMQVLGRKGKLKISDEEERLQKLRWEL